MRRRVYLLGLLALLAVVSAAGEAIDPASDTGASRAGEGIENRGRESGLLLMHTHASETPA